MAQEQPQMLQISSEQLQKLVEAVREAALSSATHAAANVERTSTGSFANCYTKFYGGRTHDEVEAFLTNVTTYKEMEGISDEHALKSASLLLELEAAVWWQGVRKEAHSWNDFIRLVREHFSPAKPCYQIYLDIFNTKQADDIPIDTFISEKRALLAQLPDKRHDEETEIDLIFGLLNIKYRKYITRSDVNSFNELLKKGRIIEYNSIEEEEAKKKREEQEEKEQKERQHRPKRCSHCHYRGHTIEECRKRKEVDN